MLLIFKNYLLFKKSFSWHVIITWQDQKKNMDIKFIPADDVKKVLHYNDLIPEMESALKKFSSKDVEQPVRSIVSVKEANG